MRLYNKTKDEIIALNVILADTFLKRLTGLIGKKRLDKSQCLIMFPCKSIHTFFMVFAIDAVFLDTHYKVIRVFRNLRPWWASPFIKNARFVIEMQTYKNSNINIEAGDTLELVNI